MQISRSNVGSKTPKQRAVGIAGLNLIIRTTDPKCRSGV